MVTYDHLFDHFQGHCLLDHIKVCRFGHLWSFLTMKITAEKGSLPKSSVESKSGTSIDRFHADLTLFLTQHMI